MSHFHFHFLTSFFVYEGEVPFILVESDFRNTYCVYGMCGISEETPPLYWRIHDGKNDADEFSFDVETACCAGYLRAGDVLILDNAIIHSGKDNKYLEEFLWREFEVMVLFLPTRAPEWNPQELVWRYLCQKMSTYSLRILRSLNAHSPAYAAHDILGQVTHEQVRSFFYLSQVFEQTLTDDSSSESDDSSKSSDSS